MSWVDVLGYAASATVLATFCTGTLIPLRILALVSNVLFCFYGYFDHLYPVLTLHIMLFPINLLRLAQLVIFRHRGRGQGARSLANSKQYLKHVFKATR